MIIATAVIQRQYENTTGQENKIAIIADTQAILKRKAGNPVAIIALRSPFPCSPELLK